MRLDQQKIDSLLLIEIIYSNLLGVCEAIRKFFTAKDIKPEFTEKPSAEFMYLFAE